MGPVIVIVVVLAIAGGVAYAVMSKGKRSSGEFLATDAPSPRSTPTPAPAVTEPVVPAEPEPVVAERDERLDELVFAEPEPEPEPEVAPARGVASAPVTELAPDVEVSVADAPIPEPAESAPVVDDAPEPMVRARITPTTIPTAHVADESEADEDDDSAVLSRFKSPGARVASIPIPAPAEPATPSVPDVEPVAAVPEPEPVVEPEPEPVVVAAEATVEPDLEPEVGERASDAALDDPEVVEVVEVVEVAAEADEPEIVAVEAEVLAAEVLDVEVTAPDPADEPADDVVVSLVDEPEAVAADALPAVTGAAGVSPVLDDPIVLTDEPVLPIAQLQAEPELDPVDHVLKALINRAKEKQVGIAEVAAELVEQANLEDRDIDEVLADLVVRADDDTVDPSERLEELTLFNDSVPRRPGQLTDFDRLDKNARKKVIIRVLCLLVAMQEDNRLKPSEPRSEAETRHWPLARAVWPVPASDADDAADDADGDKKLPGRRLARTSTKR